MYSATVLQIAPQRYLEALERPPLLLDRVEITERLAGMLMAAVARVDHWDVRVVGHNLGGTLPRVSDDDDVRVAADHPGHIRYALAFGQRRVPHLGNGYHPAPEPVHSGLERQARPRTRLEEETRHYHALAELCLLSQRLAHLIREHEDPLDFLVGEVLYRYQVPV